MVFCCTAEPSSGRAAEAILSACWIGTSCRLSPACACCLGRQLGWVAIIMIIALKASASKIRKTVQTVCRAFTRYVLHHTCMKKWFRWDPQGYKTTHLCEVIQKTNMPRICYRHFISCPDIFWFFSVPLFYALSDVIAPEKKTKHVDEWLDKVCTIHYKGY